MNYKSHIDSILFLLLVVTVLVWWMFFSNEWFLYPVLALIYTRIWWLIKHSVFTAEKLWCTPKQYKTPIILGVLFAIATWVNLWFFWSIYNIPDWIKDQRFLPMLILSVFVQELVFRAYFISAFEKVLSTKLLIFISSLVFVIIHIFLPDISVFFILLLISGIFWSWLFIKYRNIYANFISHFLINFWTPLVLMYL